MMDDHKISKFQAVVHILNGGLGSELLGTPWAMAHAGLLFGPVILTAMCFICIHCMHIVHNAATKFRRKFNLPGMEYGDVMLHAVWNGPIECIRIHAYKAKIAVNTFIVITQIGNACLFLIFAGQNIRQVVLLYWEDAPGDRVFILMCTVPVLLLISIRNLSVLSWFALLGNLLTVVSLGIVMNFVFRNVPDTSSRPLFASLEDSQMYIGAALFAFDDIAVIFSLGDALHDPNDLPFVINTGMITIYLCYLFVGMVGYLKYGHHVCGSLSLNLPVFSPYSQAARIMFGIAVLMGYIVMLFAPLEIFESWLKRYKNACLLDYILRYTLVTITCLLSLAIPNIGDYMSFIGAFGSSSIAVIFPSIIGILTLYSRCNFDDDQVSPIEYTGLVCDENANSQLRIQEKEKNQAHSSTRKNLIAVKNIFLLLFGITAFVIGTYSAISDVVHNVENNEDDDVLQRCQGGLGFNLTARLNHTSPATNATTIL